MSDILATETFALGRAPRFKSLTLTRDIVIPKGSETSPAANRVARNGDDWISILIPFGKDHTGEFTLPLEAARAFGLVE